MSDPFLGQITIFGGNFAPRGWAFCSGQLMPIAQNQALFSLLGTMYGGDGRTTFGLPDLRGRVPLHPGSGPGLPTYKQGERGGQANTTLTAANVPSHTHTATLHSEAAQGNKSNPTNRMLAGSPDQYADVNPADNVALATESIVVDQNTGGNQPFNNMNPYLGVQFIISLQGTYPSRS